MQFFLFEIYAKTNIYSVLQSGGYFHESSITLILYLRNALIKAEDYSSSS